MDNKLPKLPKITIDEYIEIDINENNTVNTINIDTIINLPNPNLNNPNNNKIIFCSGGILLTEFNLNLINLDTSCVLTQEECHNDNFEIGVPASWIKIDKEQLEVNTVLAYSDINFVEGFAGNMNIVFLKRIFRYTQLTTS
mgnify:CR=1 FL=1